MGYYITKFDETSGLTSFSATTDFLTPHVSLTKDDYNVHFFENYSKQYLTFFINSNGRVQFSGNTIFNRFGTNLEWVDK